MLWYIKLSEQKQVFEYYLLLLLIKFNVFYTNHSNSTTKFVVHNQT